MKINYRKFNIGKLENAVNGVSITEHERKFKRSVRIEINAIGSIKPYFSPKITILICLNNTTS